MPPSEGKSRWSIDTVLIALDVCFINTPPVPQSFSWERHAPAWLLEPGWSPAIPGESTGEGLTKRTSRSPALERGGERSHRMARLDDGAKYLWRVTDYSRTLNEET